MRTASIAAVALGAFVLNLAAAEPRHTVTHADIWLMKRVGAPALSPDGRFAVFSVTEPAYDRKDQVAHLWLVPTDGSAAPRRLTDGKGPESGVTWCSDNRRIAFSTRREGEGEPQVYVLDLAAGGEALKMTHAALGATGPRFSPDCSQIAFVSDVWPGARDDADNRRLAKERAERKYQARVFDGFPVRYWDRWLDERRPHLFVQALDPGAASRDLIAGTRLGAERGYAGGLSDEGATLDHAWTPDGRGLVLAASVDRDHAAYDFTSTQLWYVPAAGGEAVRLTTGRDEWGDPAFAADGRTLYAHHQPRSKHTYSATHVAALAFAVGGNADPQASADPLADSTVAARARYGLEVGAARDLTGAVDRSADSYGVAGDGTLYYLADDWGLARLYTAPAGGAGRAAGPPDHGALSALALAAHSADPVMVARFESATEPPEIVRVDATGKRTLLTHFNTERAAAIDWLPIEHFTFRSKRGRDIHSFLIKPPAFDPSKKYPLLVMLHGGPAVMNKDAFGLRWNYHLLAAPGYVIVTTDYTGSPGYGERFAQAIDGDPLAGPAEEINAAADEAIRRYPFIDATRQCAAGASYGGHLANWMQASTTRYRCLVSHAGLVNLEAQWGTSDAVYHREVMIGGPPWENSPLWRTQSPIHYAARFRTPVLVSVGEHDFRVPLNNSLEYWTALQRQRVPSRLIVWPEENHWILRGEDSRFFYDEVARWLATYLSPGR